MTTDSNNVSAQRPPMMVAYLKFPVVQGGALVGESFATSTTAVEIDGVRFEVPVPMVPLYGNVAGVVYVEAVPGPYGPAVRLNLAVWSLQDIKLGRRLGTLTITNGDLPLATKIAQRYMREAVHLSDNDLLVWVDEVLAGGAR